MVKVSVVIPTYNSARFIGRAVESVLAQTFMDFELVVVDDGSTDETQGIIAGFDDPRLRYVYQENQERSAARNAGIRLSEGSYIAFLDADDLWLSRKLAEQVHLLDESPQLGLLYSGAYLMECGRITGIWKPKHRGDVLRLLIYWDNIITSTSSVVVRRECLDQVGHFDENISSVEDWDMWLRIAVHYSFDYIPEPLIIYRMHENNTCRSFDKVERGTFALFDKILTNPEIARDVGPRQIQIRSLAYFIIGKFCYVGRNMPLARSFIVKSLAIYPFRLRAWTYLVRVILGDRLMNPLRTARSWLFRKVQAGGSVIDVERSNSC